MLLLQPVAESNTLWTTHVQSLIRDINILLGRPQPQMYPLVALNQYTVHWSTELINIIYICFKAPQTY